jgi:formylglycine-generating enzyme required for sulfatase activity
MVYIPGGRFMMGSPAGKGSKSEKPQHEVTVQPFFMGKYPITQAQWRAIASRADLTVQRNLDPNPAHFKDCKDSDRRPVERVFWYHAVEFCQRLSKLGVMKYRLPSEAEWEYACRAGTTTPFYFGDTITIDLANYNSTNDTNDINSFYADPYGYGSMGINHRETTSVGSFPPNGFGLYDMHGNVWEWCEDHWHSHYEGAPNDGSAWIDSEAPGNPKHMMRGGSWLYSRYFCRCASRYSISLIDITNIGFRVVCDMMSSK